MPRRTKAALQARRTTIHPSHYPWTEDLARFLGQMPDSEVAQHLGVRFELVRRERLRRGIPAFRPRRTRIEWTEEMLRELGTATDKDVAALLDLHPKSVYLKRRLLGIPPFCEPRPRRHAASGFTWTDKRVALLGTAPDGAIARRLGISQTVVAIKRQELRIPSHVPWAAPVSWTPEMDALLGRISDLEISRRYGIRTPAIRNRRKALKVAPFKEAPHKFVRTADLLEILQLPAREVTARHGVAPRTIAVLRRELGLSTPMTPHQWTEAELARLGQDTDAAIGQITLDTLQFAVAVEEV